MKVLGTYSSPLRTILMGDSMQDAAETLGFFDVGALPVVEHGRLIGIVTERDVIRALADGCALHETPVEDYASREPVWIEADDDMTRARELMAEKGIRHLPVVDGGEVIGMVSVRDVVEHSIN